MEEIIYKKQIRLKKHKEDAMKDSFIFYRSYYEAMNGLKDKEKLQLYNAISELSLNGNELKMTGICKNIFTAIKPQILANNERYENGKKGGRPKNKTIGFEKNKTIGFENKKPNNNDNVNDNVNENDNDDNNNILTTTIINNASDSCVDGLQDIIEFYNNNIGAITPYGLDLFKLYLKNFDKDMIILAMQISVEANARNMQYIKSILNNWKNKGIKTIIEAQEESQKYKKSTVIVFEQR